jgi:two-component system cell cycle response regulator DivK
LTALVILIVDDDARNRKLARDVLRAAGFDTLEAASGEDAIALAREELPDLVLLDLRLPGLDGAETLQHLRAEPATARIPVVALTALAGARQALAEAGFDGILEKPIDVGAFPEQVRALSRRRGDSTAPGREGGTLDGSRRS